MRRSTHLRIDPALALVCRCGLALDFYPGGSSGHRVWRHYSGLPDGSSQASIVAEAGGARVDHSRTGSRETGEKSLWPSLPSTGVKGSECKVAGARTIFCQYRNLRFRVLVTVDCPRGVWTVCHFLGGSFGTA